MAPKKRVSLKTIAEAANVSPSTASLVLNNRGKELRISAETQERVCKIASELGYGSSTMNTTGTKGDVSPARFCILVFITADFQNLPIPRFNAGLEKYVQDSVDPVDWTYHTFHPHHLKDYQALLTPDVCDGAIITTPSHRDALFLEANSFEVPIILYNYQINGYTCICHDDYDIGCRAASVFQQHQKKRIGIVLPSFANRGINLRLAGFTSYLKEHGYSKNEISISHGPNKDMLGGTLATAKMLESGFVPDAIYIVNDLMTGGVINHLKSAGLRIPEDVFLLSYGDNDAANMIPSVSSYISEAEKMAYTCMEQLLLEQKGEAAPGRYISFGTECSWRDSCPPPPPTKKSGE